MTLRYKLRTLLILLAILPPLLWIGWTKCAAWKAEQERKAREAMLNPIDRYVLQRLQTLGLQDPAGDMAEVVGIPYINLDAIPAAPTAEPAK